MSKHVFISYSRKNAEIMSRVDRVLRMKGIPTWTDRELIPGTSQWKAAIESAIEGAGAVVVLMSPDAKASEWIDRELEYARMRSIPIIPILIEGDPVSAVPFELVSSQRLDMSSEDKFTAGTDQLIKTVLDMMGLKAKTKYQLLHTELIQFAAKIPDLLWVGVISIDGLTEGFVSKTATMEEDRVAAMSAATISMSERISSELGMGVMRFVVTMGSQGVIFSAALGEEEVLMFAVDQCASVDRILALMSEGAKPLLEVLELPTG